MMIRARRSRGSRIDHVVPVVLVEVVRLERVVDQVRPLHVAGGVEALDAGQLLGLADASSVRWQVCSFSLTSK